MFKSTQPGELERHRSEITVGRHAVEFLEQLQARNLRDLYRYWNALRGIEAMPFRDEVIPAAIANLLPFVTLLQVQRQPLRFRYSFVGAGIRATYSCELTGHFSDEPGMSVCPNGGHAMLCTVAKTGAPAHHGGEFEHEDGYFVHQECLALPLTRDGVEVDMILMGQKWEAQTGPKH